MSEEAFPHKNWFPVINHHLKVTLSVFVMVKPFYLVNLVDFYNN